MRGGLEESVNLNLVHRAGGGGGSGSQSLIQPAAQLHYSSGPWSQKVEYHSSGPRPILSYVLPLKRPILLLSETGYWVR